MDGGANHANELATKPIRYTMMMIITMMIIITTPLNNT